MSVLGLRGSAIVELVTEGHDPPLEASVGISAVVTLLADCGSPVEDSVRFIWDHLRASHSSPLLFSDNSSELSPREFRIYQVRLGEGPGVPSS